MAAAACMIQGTGSDVGKSVIVAGLARAFTRRGLAVRPFKPQNMSNNAAVTGDGGEIGRAQALQALACGVPPSTDMNPVLLKPQSDTGAQLIVHGKVVGIAHARNYRSDRRSLLPEVLKSYDRLAGPADLVLIEGAGSPAEVNLRDGDIANMGFAEAADVPVVLLGDIDRGGVIAALAGTHLLLSGSERARVKGFLINKFRGDLALFDGGLRAIEETTGWPGLGVIPFLAEAARLPAEDAVVLQRYAKPGGGAIRIAVPMLSRIANFDDFDPLAAEPDVDLRMIPPGTPLPGDADLVILPGTKATVGDLKFLRAQGWDIDLAAHVRRGGRVLGICGGFQMLGQSVSDPDGIEGPAGTVAGLGLIDVDTVIAGAKALEQVAGRHEASGEAIAGYEMHVGETTGPGRERPFLVLESSGAKGGRPEGAVSADGRIAGCYVHGLFAADGFRHAYLATFRARGQTGTEYGAGVEAALDALAGHLEKHVDLDAILAIARGGSN